ncbi:hypothetical protein STANM309S_06074 [Streptomyces tanashiensis]
MLRHALAATVLTVGALAPSAPAAAAEGPCRPVGTAGVADLVPGDSTLGLSALPPATVDLPARISLRGTTETFNRRWSFAVREGRMYVKEGSASGGWRTMNLPDCLDGRITGISVDDDELVALDESGRIHTMDHALNAPWTWNWTYRYGAPLWLGDGNTVPYGSTRWTWSVLSPGEDKVWRDSAGNDHPVGGAKVSHVFALSPDGSRITYVDPWLPADHSYEMATPHRGRFRAEALSTAASTSFVVNRYGDLYTRLYDFDIAGSDRVFFSYSYEDQRGAAFPKKPRLAEGGEEPFGLGLGGLVLVHPRRELLARDLPGEGDEVRGRGGGKQAVDIRVGDFSGGQTGAGAGPAVPLSVAPTGAADTPVPGALEYWRGDRDRRRRRPPAGGPRSGAPLRPVEGLRPPRSRRAVRPAVPRASTISTRARTARSGRCTAWPAARSSWSGRRSCTSSGTPSARVEARPEPHLRPDPGSRPGPRSPSWTAPGTPVTRRRGWSPRLDTGPFFVGVRP